MKIPSTAGMLLAAIIAPLLAGCRTASEDPAPENESTAVQRTVRVLVIDDGDLAQTIERQWQARSGGQVELKQATSAEIVAATEPRLGVDLVVYPSGLLGELAERGLIEAIPDDTLDAQGFNRTDVFELLRLRETRWGEDRLAVTLGSPQLTLLYRKDIFDALGLQPPESWSDYQNLAGRLAKRDGLGELGPPPEAAWQATLEPLGPGWASQAFLARAAPYAQHRSQYSTLFDRRTMEPLIAGPPFVKALEELVAAASYLPAEARAMTPADVRREFFAGHCAMALTWPSRAGSSGTADSGGQVATGVRPLPGSASVFNFRNGQWEQRGEGESRRVPLLAASGRMVSLTREGRRSGGAVNMLVWLGGGLASEIAPASPGTTLFRQSQLATVSRWVNPELDSEAAREYGEAVQATQNEAAALISLRIPGRDRYLAALDAAVQSAVAGDASPADALAGAVVRWNEITDESGRDRQQAAYTRSIGLKP